MLVSDLIRELEKYDPNLPVIRNGYEGGVDDIEGVNLTKIALNVNTQWYVGKHEIIEDYDYRDYSQYPQVSAVIIN